MGKKQNTKAVKKVKEKKTVVKKVAAKKVAAKKVTAKKAIVKKAVAKKAVVKKSASKSAKPAAKKSEKVLAKPKQALVKKVVKPVEIKAIAKPEPKAVAKPAVTASKPAAAPSKPAVKTGKPAAKAATPAPAVAEKKIVKKIIVPAKKKEIHPNQYTIEYPIHASASLLFEIISSPSGLSEWFADNVNIRDGNFTFFWDGSQQTAKMVAYKEEKMVRFRWTDKPEYTFFEFKIETDELTNDTSLIITDFAEDGDKESAKLLWDNQINGLKHAIGS